MHIIPGPVELCPRVEILLEAASSSADPVETLRGLFQIAERLAWQILPAHPAGFTWDLWSGCHPDFAADDYVVSEEGYEAAFEGHPSIGALSRWIAAALPALAAPNRYVGGWFDEKSGRYFLDVSMIVTGRSLALRMAEFHRQRFIYHPASDTCVAVPASESIAAIPTGTAEIGVSAEVQCDSRGAES